LIGGIADSAMMRAVDVFLAIPGLFIVLIVAVRYGASVLGLSLIIGAFTWLIPARLVRGEVLTLRTRDFFSAARTA
jgi:peptide/nickel transport system permease protein